MAFCTSPLGPPSAFGFCGMAEVLRPGDLSRVAVGLARRAGHRRYAHTGTEESPLGNNGKMRGNEGDR